MATGVQTQQSSTQAAQATKRFLGGYINPNDGTVRLVTDPAKLSELRLQTCTDSRWR